MTVLICFPVAGGIKPRQATGGSVSGIASTVCACTDVSCGIAWSDVNLGVAADDGVRLGSSVTLGGSACTPAK
ncbi:hypothetical protein [Sodalis sp.]|uniref:hypothetical protein n=1 Tax=Sodalis sp. (in: enterobacteria) TaxID=1898979 RepID=UPI0038737C9C